MKDTYDSVVPQLKAGEVHHYEGGSDPEAGSADFLPFAQGMAEQSGAMQAFWVTRMHENVAFQSRMMRASSLPEAQALQYDYLCRTMEQYAVQTGHVMSLWKKLPGLAFGATL